MSFFLVLIRIYRLEIQSVMLVFRPSFVNYCPPLPSIQLFGRNFVFEYKSIEKSLFLHCGFAVLADGSGPSAAARAKEATALSTLTAKAAAAMWGPPASAAAAALVAAAAEHQSSVHAGWWCVVRARGLQSENTAVNISVGITSFCPDGSYRSYQDTPKSNKLTKGTT
jgi:hypothetical protein